MVAIIYWMYIYPNNYFLTDTLFYPFLLSFILSPVSIMCSLSRWIIYALVPLPTKVKVDTVSISLMSTHILFLPSGHVSEISSFFLGSSLFRVLMYIYPIPMGVIYCSWRNLLSPTLLFEILICLAMLNSIPLNFFRVSLVNYFYTTSTNLSSSSRVSAISIFF